MHSSAQRIDEAVAAGRKTFSQLREEAWTSDGRLKANPSVIRYAHLDLGHRKHGMVRAEMIQTGKHGRKGKPTQPLGGKSGRAYRAHGPRKHGYR